MGLVVAATFALLPLDRPTRPRAAGRSTASSWRCASSSLAAGTRILTRRFAGDDEIRRLSAGSRRRRRRPSRACVGSTIACAAPDPSRRRPRRACSLLGLAACGSTSKDAARGGSVVGDSLTVYSSLPLRGPFAERMRAMVNGEKLAISDAGGKVGDWTIKFASLDDAAGPDGWDPSATADNARTAAQDPTTIAYLGDADFGATAISLPILNEAGVAQISPASTYPGFTADGGRDREGRAAEVPALGRADVRPRDPLGRRRGAGAGASTSAARAAGARSSSTTRRSRAARWRRRSSARCPRPASRWRATSGFDLGKDDQTVGGAGRAPRRVPTACSSAPARTRSPTALWQALHAALPTARLFAPADLARPAFLATLLGGRAGRDAAHPADRCRASR